MPAHSKFGAKVKDSTAALGIEAEDDGEPSEEKMPSLVAAAKAQFAESAKQGQATKTILMGLGHGG